MTKPTRTYLFNLVIYSQSEERRRYFEEMVMPLIEKYPCRILFIEGMMEDKSDLCQVFCLAPSKEQQEFLGKSDRMVIRASKQNLAKAPVLILPYLIPDLPVFLIWGQDPTKESEVLPTFLNLATRLIFDNDCVFNIAEFAESMLKILGSLNVDLMDVDWAHTAGIREAFGNIFESENSFKELQNAKKITIQYTSCKNSKMEHPNRRALYLQGWLAALLEWELKTRDGDNIHYTGHEVMLQKVEESDGVAGEITKIIIDEIVEIEKLETGSGPLLRVIPNNAPPYQLPIPNMRGGLAFIKEIFYHPISNHYKKTLEMIARI